MTICRYFQQGTCRFGSRCRYDHVFANTHTYGGGYAGGGGNNFGGYRSSGGAAYSNNYNYGGSYGSGGGGGGNEGASERAGTSILRAKAGTQYQQNSGNIFGQPVSNPTSYQPGFFSSNVTDPKPAPVQREVKEILQMIINEFTLWEHSGQWPLSCFSLFKDPGCFPSLIEYSPEEIRWYMYQARARGNLEECKQLINGIYVKAKQFKEQFMTPNAEVYEILARMARGERMETPAAPLISENPALSASIFGSANGGNMQPSSQVASSFTFALPNKAAPAANNQNFPLFGAPQGNVFPNTFPSTIFSNVTTPNPSIFGGQIPQISQTVNVPSIGSGFFGTNSNAQNVNDSNSYTPMEDMTEEILNAFNAPVYAMGSVPSKPPPKELCGLGS